MKDDSLYFRKMVLRALIQADYDQKSGGKILTTRIKKYLPEDLTRNDLTNALRFLEKAGWIKRSEEGYGWKVTQFSLTDLCFRHGFTNCPVCDREKVQEAC